MPNSSAPAQLPVLEVDEVRLLQAVWDGLDRSGQWPTFEAIDRTLLNGYDDIDLPELISRIPPAFLHGGRPQGGARADPNGRLSLTVAGAALCSGTEQVLQVVVAASRLGANAFRWGDPDEPATVTFDQVLDELGLDLSKSEEKELGQRSALLLSLEPWRTHSSIDEGRWSFHLDRDIRLYDGVETFEQYWQARERQLAAQQVLLPSQIWAPAQYGDEPAGQVTSGSSAETASAPEATSQPPLGFLGLMLAPLGAILAVIQATSSVSAQIIGSILAALMMVVIFVCRESWHRRWLRYASLIALILLGLGVAVVVIAGNAAN